MTLTGHIHDGTVGNILAKPITARSRYLVSACCQAGVIQVFDFAPEVFFVLCSRCFREAGSPGREDVDMAQLRSL